MSFVNSIIGTAKANGKSPWTKQQMVTALGLKAQGVSNEKIGELTGHPKLSVQYLFGTKLPAAEKKYASKEEFFSYLEITDDSAFQTAANAALGKETEVA